MKASHSVASNGLGVVPEQRPRKLPRQQRARFTFEAALDATEDLLVRNGVAMLTTNHVAERAGISIGSLYQYFPNKVALLQTVWQRHVAGQIEEVEKVAALPQSCDLEAGLRHIIHEAILLHANRLKFHRELAEFTSRSQLPTWYGWLMDRRNVAMVRLLARHCPDWTPHDLRDRATLICDLGRSVINASVDSSRKTLDVAGLEDSIVMAMLTQLNRETCPQAG